MWTVSRNSLFYTFHFQFMKAQIDMIGIITSQFDEMLTFYRDTMWFEVLLAMEGSYVEFDNDGVRFAISTNDVMADATWHESYKQSRSGQSLELAFRMDTPGAVDSTFMEIISKGAEPVKRPADMPRGQRAAFFSDPDGNIHEIFADLPKTSNGYAQ